MRGPKRWIPRVLGAAALVAVVALVAARFARGAPVAGVAVERAEAIQTVLVSGRVLPPAEVEVTARVEAPVLEVLADEGDAVDAGALLARFDATAFEAEVAGARATLARARAASGRSRRIAPEVAQQQLRTAEVQLTEARRTLEQTERLVASGAWPRDRLASARDTLARAESAERSAELELSAARGADRRAAAATVEEALASLRLAEERLTHAVVRAPVAGVVLERQVEEGDTARPGVELFHLAADGPPILSRRSGRAPPLSARARAARSGRHRRLPRAPLRRAGELHRRRPSSPSAARSRCASCPPPRWPSCAPTWTVSVEIEVGRAEDALVVPARLVHDAATDEPRVWIAPEGRLVRREITLGLRGDEQLQVVEGLSEGDLVLDVVDVRLGEGDRVRVEP